MVAMKKAELGSKPPLSSISVGSSPLTNSLACQSECGELCHESTEIHTRKKSTDDSNNSSIQAPEVQISQATVEEPTSAFFLPLVRHVRKSRTITGRQFTLISRWVLLFCLLVNGCVFGLFFALSYKSTEFFTPTSEKRIAIVCNLVGLGWVMVQFLATMCYCLLHTKHPLVKSRGTDYLIYSLVGAYVPAIIFSVFLMFEIGVWTISVLGAAVLQTLGMAFVMLFMASQLARARLMYLLFLKRAFNMTHAAHLYTYAFLAVWILLISAGIFTLSYIDRQQYHLAIDIFVMVGINGILLVTLYYTYLTRSILQAFSDTNANLLTSAVVALTVNVGFLLRTLVFENDEPITFTNPPKIGAGFVNTYLVYFTSTIVSVHLYGTIAWIVRNNIDTTGELDPRSVFANTWANVTGGSEYGPNIAERSAFTATRLTTGETLATAQPDTAHLAADKALNDTAATDATNTTSTEHL